MPSRKKRIKQAEVVRLFAERLREVRRAHGLTQSELARQAHVSVAYVGRLESGGAAPGLDLVDRLAKALGVTLTDLLPATAPPDTLAVLRDQARRLFEVVLQTADRETLRMLCPLLARLTESPRGR